MTDPSYCPLCGRTGPVTESEVALNTVAWRLQVEHPVICGGSCYMLPALSLVRNMDREDGRE